MIFDFVMPSVKCLYTLDEKQFFVMFYVKAVCLSKERLTIKSYRYLYFRDVKVIISVRIELITSTIYVLMLN